MAELELDYHLYPVFRAAPHRTWFLDRDFLSHGEDVGVSCLPAAPCLRHRAGSWWLDNDSDRTEAVVTIWSDVTGRIDIPRACSYAFPDGHFEVFPWDGARYKLSVRVIGSDVRATRPHADTVRPPKVPTLIGLPESEEQVNLLFERDPRTRTILAALYWEYLTRGSRPPRPQTREEARRCMGFATPNPIDAALQKVQRAIWGELGHPDEVPKFLIHRRLLRPEHQMLIPHRQCSHRDAASGRFRF